MPGELAKRIAVAGIGIPLVVAAVYVGGWPLGGLLALIAAGAAWELFGLAGRRGVRPFAVAGALAAAALVLVAAAARSPIAAAPAALALALLMVLGLAAAAIVVRGPQDAPLPAVAVTVFGALYTGGTLAFAVFLRHLPAGAEAGGTAWLGTALVVFPLAVVWLNDTCAYFVGQRWGRRKLSPTVSPGKTVEGAIAGLAGAVVASMAYAALVFGLWLEMPMGLIAAAAVGLVVGVVAQMGDLAESLLKREAGVKDSGRLLPGHGGLLDRLDALFFALPVGYACLALWLGAGGGA